MNLISQKQGYGAPSRRPNKSFNIRKVTTVVLLMIFYCISSAKGYPQKTTLTLDLQNVTMEQALEDVKQQSGYSLWYRNEEVDLYRTVSIKIKNADVAAVLDKLLSGQNLFYTIEDKHIIIHKNSSVSRSGSTAPSPQQERRRISGTVTDTSGEPIIGVNIVEKGTANGTVTDLDGRFAMDVDGSGSIIVVSYVGYNPVEVLIGSNSSLSIQLIEDTKLLEEVVVVGYGITKKRDLTGAVGAVKMDEMVSSSPSVDAGQFIAGRIAGVQVLTSSGRPGVSSTVQIRGVNSITATQAPLVVVDGIQMPDFDLNLIPPDNIESIDILKDAASAAIYGSRGTNGVILITTKSGSEGKGRLNVGYKFTIQKVLKEVEMMNGYEYAEAAKDAIQNAWIDDAGDPNAPNSLAARGNYKYTWPEALDNPSALLNTDWQDLVTRTAPMHQADLKYSWGSSKSNFSVYLGVVEQEGILITSDYQKFSMSLQAAAHVTDWMQVGGMMTTIYDQDREPMNRTFEWAVQYPRIYPVYGENGYLGEPLTTPGFENYNSLLFRAKNGHPLYNIDYKINNANFKNYGNVFAALDIIDGLKFKTTFNYYINRADRKEYQTKDHNMGPSFVDPGIGIATNNKMLFYTTENLLTYNKDFGDHSVTGLLGYEANYRRRETLQASRTDYENDLVPYLVGGNTLRQAQDSDVETSRISWFARGTYSYMGKYMASASIRRDGSSRFGTNSRWGYFPSVSGAWRFSDESFFKPLNKLANTAKIRASYGVTGNDGIGDYSWTASLEKGKIVYGNSIQSSYYPGKISNPDLKWESLQQLNLGLDLGLFNNRIMMELDWYRSYCDGLLLNVPIPSTSGFTTELKNIGELENKGMEFNLTTRNLVGKFQWQTIFNISQNRSKVLSLGKDDAPIIYYPSNMMGLISEVGQELYQFYGYNYLGVIMNEEELAQAAKYPNIEVGYGKFEDVNKDGVIDSNDRTSLGSNIPNFIWGMTNTFKYKNFDLSFLMQGVYGSKIFDMNIHRTMYYHEGRNYGKDMLNRYRSPEQPGNGWNYKLNRNLKRMEAEGSTYMIRDGSYIRLKNISLGYAIPKKLAEKLSLGAARLFVNMTNLLTISDYPGMDPENFNGSSTDANRRGVTHSEYPTAKTFTIGFNLEL